MLLFNKIWKDTNWCCVVFENLRTFTSRSVVSILPRTTWKSYISTSSTIFDNWRDKYCLSQQVLCKKETVSSFHFSKYLNIIQSVKASALVGSTHQIGRFTGVSSVTILFIAFKILSAYF
jgi:hypothetical protein